MSLKMQRIVLFFISMTLFFFLGRWSVPSEVEVVADSTTTTEKVAEVTQENQLEKIKKSGQLNVVIVNGPTTYFVGATGPEGFEYMMMKEFAEYLGVTLKLHVAATVNEALKMTEEGIGDMTAGALTKTAAREKSFAFTPSYYNIKEVVVCDQNLIRKKIFPRSLEDLVGLKVTVGDNTSYAESLEAIQKELPELHFNRSKELSSEELLGLVAKGKIDCSVVDSNIFSVNNRYYPGLRKAFNLGENKALGFVLRSDSEALNTTFNGWLNHVERSGKMARLKDHYYSYTNTFNYVNLTAFHKRLKTRLPKYETLFKKAGKKYDIPWTLLAAQSYQESHWDRLAKSPTGVRGLMMLTRVTAKEMGIKYRTNATSSIYGGAKYFKQIYDRIADDVKGIDRYKFAYVAYNVGMGHLLDARALARKLGKDPSSWKDIKTVLPLLSKKKYYRHLKYGYARGQEPVDYVKAIYEYHVILEHKYKKVSYEK